VVKEDFDSIAGGATAVGISAENLGQDLRALETTVTAGNPWGSDEAGSVFGMAYTAVLGHAVEVLGSHVELLGGGAEKLGVWGLRSELTELENTLTAATVDPSTVDV
jgi:hypothetical protein